MKKTTIYMIEEDQELAVKKAKKKYDVTITLSYLIRKLLRKFIDDNDKI